MVGYGTGTYGDASGHCYNFTTYAPTPEADCTREMIALQRRDEMRADALRTAGVESQHVFSLGFHDTELAFEDRKAVAMAAVGVIRSFKPDAVFVHHPYPDMRAQPARIWSDANFHPDHQALGKIIWDAEMAMAISRVWPGLGEGVSPDLYFFAFNNATTQVGITHYVDITGAPMAAKSAGYLHHRSQYWPGGAAAFEGQLKLMGAAIARNAGAPAAVEYAEGFTATVNPY